jgi:serine/threonine protein kinase
VREGDEVAGRYRLDELRGRGPMSEVWRAHDDTLDRTVALKILSPTADLERFRREARAVAGLAHENVMRVYDYGEDEAGPYMALEWLPGGTLEDRLAQGALPPDETHRVAAGMAAGLAHLHSRGLVHRDLKPANVLFDEEGRPKLGDFGLVRGTAGADTLTEDGTVLGTAAYISPEQATGEPAGASSDVYSFGVILFRMLTGSLPFTADSALALVDLHRHAPPPAVESMQPDAPPRLAALTAAALRKDPARRPADGAALLSALGAAPAAYADTEATQIIPASSTPPSGGRNRGRLAIAGAVVLLAAAGGVLAWGVTRTGTTAPGKGAPGRSATGTHSGTRAQATQTQGTTGRTVNTGDHTTSNRQTTATTAHTTTSATTTRRTTTTTPTTSPTTTLGTTTTPTTTPTTSGIGTTTAATGTT